MNNRVEPSRLSPAALKIAEARAEAFNAFNWFNPSTNPLTITNSPIVNLNNVQFGRITAADDPRIMQFAIKYSF